MPESPLRLVIAPTGTFKFTWHGWPLTMFTLPEAYHVRQDYPHMTIVDQRLRIVDDSEQNTTSDETETEES